MGAEHVGCRVRVCVPTPTCRADHGADAAAIIVAGLLVSYNDHAIYGIGILHAHNSNTCPLMASCSQEQCCLPCT